MPDYITSDTVVTLAKGFSESSKKMIMSVGDGATSAGDKSHIEIDFLIDHKNVNNLQARAFYEALIKKAGLPLWGAAGSNAAAHAGKTAYDYSAFIIEKGNLSEEQIKHKLQTAAEEILNMTPKQTAIFTIEANNAYDREKKQEHDFHKKMGIPDPQIGIPEEKGSKMDDSFIGSGLAKNTVKNTRGGSQVG